MTSNVFAEQPAGKISNGRHYFLSTNTSAVTVSEASETHNDDKVLPTLESIAAEKHARQIAASSEERNASLASSNEQSTQLPESEHEQPRTAQEYEDEDSQQGAFNPETGEINWDCPCLGGMAHGPCGDEFKAAFSCFVYSTEEPKGMDCIEKFK
jgi:intermembrane space import and assembly protein 40